MASILTARLSIAILEIGYILWTDWDKASEEARKRNMAN